jgi:hypothetical protein
MMRSRRTPFDWLASMLSPYPASSTLLHALAAQQRDRAAELLRAAPYLVGQFDRATGLTPLMWSIVHGDAEAFAQVLAVDPELARQPWTNALSELAPWQPFPEPAGLARRDKNALIVARVSRERRLFQQLLDTAGPEELTRTLSFAVAMDDVAFINGLVAQGAEPNRPVQRSFITESAFLHAIRLGREKAFEALFDLADLSVVSRRELPQSGDEGLGDPEEEVLDAHELARAFGRSAFVARLDHRRR